MECFETHTSEYDEDFSIPNQSINQLRVPISDASPPTSFFLRVATTSFKE